MRGIIFCRIAYQQVGIQTKLIMTLVDELCELYQMPSALLVADIMARTNPKVLYISHHLKRRSNKTRKNSLKLQTLRQNN